MTQNYNRTYEVIFGIPVNADGYKVQEGIVNGDFVIGDTFCTAKQEPPKPLKITKLPFSLSCKRGSGKGSTTESTIATFNNMNEETVKFISQSGMKMMVYAGYGGNNDLIYTGDVITVDERKLFPGTEVTIQLKDAYNSLKDVRVALTYDKSLSAKEIITDLASRFPDVTVGTIAVEALNYQFKSQGLSVFGTAHKVMKELSRNWGFVFSIQNGVFSATNKQINNGDDDYKIIRQKAVKLTPSLIKEIGKITDNSGKLPGQSDTKSGVRVKIFLKAFEVGGFVVIEGSDIYDGTYKVKTLEYDLQFRGQPWDVNLELELV